MRTPEACHPALARAMQPGLPSIEADDDEFRSAEPLADDSSNDGDSRDDRTEMT